jgi:hypothetical protein
LKLEVISSQTAKIELQAGLASFDRLQLDRRQFDRRNLIALQFDRRQFDLLTI